MGASVIVNRNDAHASTIVHDYKGCFYFSSVVRNVVAACSDCFHTKCMLAASVIHSKLSGSLFCHGYNFTAIDNSARFFSVDIFFIWSIMFRSKNKIKKTKISTTLSNNVLSDRVRNERQAI